MSDFNNRIYAQGKLLKVVNSVQWQEELYGLSSGAIERWVKSNSIKQSSPLIIAINLVASKLFFLANKSQEQITEEYSRLSLEVEGLTEHVSNLIQGEYFD